MPAARCAASTGRKRVNLRADALEALIAAIYLDGGIDAARAFILRYWEPRSSAIGEAPRDPKTELQEWVASGRRRACRSTRSTAARARTTSRVFTVSVTVAGFEPATGSGRSKRAGRAGGGDGNPAARRRLDNEEAVA